MQTQAKVKEDEWRRVAVQHYKNTGPAPGAAEDSPPPSEAGPSAGNKAKGDVIDAEFEESK